MIAYNKIWLENLFVQQETQLALEQNCITAQEKENIILNYPVAFYSPNIFIRIGLFLLTKVILTFSFGFLALLFLSVIEQFASGLAIFFAIVSYVALEFMLQRKKHYCSGVDDALLWGTAIALFCGISFSNELGGLENCVLIFIISLLSTIRFADRLMAAICFISFLGFIFFLAIRIGGTAKEILPFIVMIISLITYLVVKKINDPKTFNVYAGCFVIIEIVSLFTLYIAGNYWVVMEMSNAMFNLQLQPGQSIPFGFIFWLFTLVIPFIYLSLGIKNKNLVLLRVGLLLLAAIVFTVRYYHAILAPEIAMVIAGLLMIVFAWALTRYLRVPKYGFTQEELFSSHVLDNMQIESLVLAETFSQQPQNNDGTSFGGGSFGGGGASGDF